MVNKKLFTAKKGYFLESVEPTKKMRAVKRHMRNEELWQSGRTANAFELSAVSWRQLG